MHSNHFQKISIYFSVCLFNNRPSMLLSPQAPTKSNHTSKTHSANHPTKFHQPDSWALPFHFRHICHKSFVTELEKCDWQFGLEALAHGNLPTQQSWEPWEERWRVKSSWWMLTNVSPTVLQTRMSNYKEHDGPCQGPWNLPPCLSDGEESWYWVDQAVLLCLWLLAASLVYVSRYLHEHIQSPLLTWVSFRS